MSRCELTLVRCQVRTVDGALVVGTGMTATTYFTLRWFNTAPPQPGRGGTRAHRVRRAGVHALRPNGQYPLWLLLH